jgi:hypothetical protein
MPRPTPAVTTAYCDDSLRPVAIYAAISNVAKSVSSREYLKGRSGYLAFEFFPRL